MPDDTVVQLRRNQSKQTVSRNHLLRHGKSGKGSSTWLSKTSGNPKRNLSSSIPRSQSATSLNLAAKPHNNPAHAEGSREPSKENDGSTLPHTQSYTRLSKGRGSYIGTAGGAAGLGTHRHKGLSSGLGSLAYSHRKPVIQLEKDEDEEDDRENLDTTDFEDTDSADEEPVQRPPVPRLDSQLNIGIQKVEPTPPKISEETVISVSSLADMASALKGARSKSGFVDDTDLISTAVDRSKNLGDMAQMVQGWNTNSKGKGRASQPRVPFVIGMTDRSRSNGSPRDSPAQGDEDPREFEKVFREYTNARAVGNPVISSLCRISAAQESSLHRSGSGPSSRSSSVDGGSLGHHQSSLNLQLPSVKKVNSLVATTANLISEFPDKKSEFSYAAPQSHGAIESVSTYMLNKIWQQGSRDRTTASKAPVSQPAAPASINRQAARVQQQITGSNNTRPQSKGSTIKLS